MWNQRLHFAMVEAGFGVHPNNSAPAAVKDTKVPDSCSTSQPRPIASFSRAILGRAAAVAEEKRLVDFLDVDVVPCNGSTALAISRIRRGGSFRVGVGLGGGEFQGALLALRPKDIRAYQVRVCERGSRSIGHTFGVQLLVNVARRDLLISTRSALPAYCAAAAFD
jgi:hypothetical protein